MSDTEKMTGVKRPLSDKQQRNLRKKLRKQSERALAQGRLPEGKRALALMNTADNLVLKVIKYAVEQQPKGQLRTHHLQQLLIASSGGDVNAPTWAMLIRKHLLVHAVVVIVDGLNETLVQRYRKELTCLDFCKDTDVFSPPASSNSNSNSNSNNNVKAGGRNDQKSAHDDAQLTQAALQVLDQHKQLAVKLPYSSFSTQVVSNELLTVRAKLIKGLDLKKRKSATKKNTTSPQTSSSSSSSSSASSSSSSSALDLLPPPEYYILTHAEMVQNRYPVSATQAKTATFTDQNDNQGEAVTLPTGCQQGVSSAFACGQPICVCVPAALSASKQTLFGIDCEMVQTENAPYELARVTVVTYTQQQQSGDSSSSSSEIELKTVYDTLVKPDYPITDYLTKYSGITAELMDPVTTTLAQVQAHLKTFIARQDILVGHSMENDMKALQLYHDRIVDTAVLFPRADSERHSKHSLRYLTKKYLFKDIQDQSKQVGHSSEEDAVSALQLALLKFNKGPEFGKAVSKTSVFAHMKKPVYFVDQAEGLLSLGALPHRVNTISCTTDGNVCQKAAKLVKTNTESFVFARFSKLKELCNTERIGPIGPSADFKGELLHDAVVELNAQITKVFASTKPRSLLMLISGDQPTTHMNQLKKDLANASSDKAAKNQLHEAVWKLKTTYEHGVCFIGTK
jgi:DNA polymerase III epsilon subunit-like protein